MSKAFHSIRDKVLKDTLALQEVTVSLVNLNYWTQQTFQNGLYIQQAVGWALKGIAYACVFSTSTHHSYSTVHIAVQWFTVPVLYYVATYACLSDYELALYDKLPPRRPRHLQLKNAWLQSPSKARVLLRVWILLSPQLLCTQVQNNISHIQLILSYILTWNKISSTAWQ